MIYLGKTSLPLLPITIFFIYRNIFEMFYTLFGKSSTLLWLLTNAGYKN